MLPRMSPLLARVAKVSLLLSLVAGCAQVTTPIGDAPKDGARIAEAPALAHYLGALDGSDGMTVGDLFDPDRALTFSAPPTPGDLHLRQRASNPAAATDARTLRVLTYNVALLDAKLFGLIPYTATPDLELRAPVLFDLVLEAGHDVLLLQEVWRPEDLERLREAAQRHGYWIATSDRKGMTDGLAIAVKQSVSPGPTEVGFASYDQPSANLEFFPAPGLNRGFVYARFEVEGVGPVVVYDTHASAFPESFRDRMSNVRQLALHAAARPADEVVIIGGDLNGGSYYRSNDWTLPDGTVQSLWFANTLSYALMLHYADAVDLAIRGAPSDEAALGDITFGDTVPEVMDEAWCARTPDTVFTATDCNSLYREQYEGTEFPARMDLIFARDPEGRVHVADAQLAFVEPVPYGDKRRVLSDHYGQSVTLRIAPRR